VQHARANLSETVAMKRSRIKDGLVGAAIAVLGLLLAGGLVLWWISEPVDDSPPADPPRTTNADRQQRTEPPSDLVEGETWLGNMVLDAGTLATTESLLHDVTAIGQDVRTGPDSLVAGSLTVDATVPFEVVAEQVGGEGTTVSAASSSQATVERTVELAGRELRVVATGTVKVRNDKLVVEPRSIDIGGPDEVSEALAAVARGLVTIEHSFDALPPGLVLKEVTVQDDGFRANLVGQDVQLVPEP